MSNRPKITIKKKGDPVPEPVREVVEKVTKEVPAPPEPTLEEKQPKPTTPNQVNYDEFAKPIPWGKILGAIGGVLAIGAIVFFFVLPLFGSDEEDLAEPENVESEENVVKSGTLIKDLLPKGSEKIEDILSENTTLRDLMNKIGIPNSDAKVLDREGSKHPIRRLRAGDKYTVAHTPENETEVLMLMIEPKNEPYAFYKIDARESLSIEKMDKKVEIRENYIAAIVEGTLGQTFIDNNLNLKLISSIEEVLAWTVDLFDVGDGDRFKVLYDEEFVNGKPYRIDRVKALYFKKDGEDYFAFRNEQGDKEFYSELGQSMKRSFLATPIKYGGVITSGYGLRTHPVTGHTKEHLGTDFAAPEGTPIQAVADGVVTIATFTSNNGNYVKLKHDKTYTTQYLHMQKFADNIRPGVRVRQGQVIGYVGTTGLSTGPHVCYRFWKNDKQEDPTRENSASGGRIASREIQEYYKYIEPIKNQIKEINYF
jgi:murein DD-endopeptidase MepM/ murein hydrolase activator NlpD